MLSGHKAPISNTNVEVAGCSTQDMARWVVQDGAAPTGITQQPLVPYSPTCKITAIRTHTIPAVHTHTIPAVHTAQAAAARRSESGFKQSKKPTDSSSINPQCPQAGTGTRGGKAAALGRRQTASWFFLLHSPVSRKPLVQYLLTLEAAQRGDIIVHGWCGFPSSC